jgi:hypothetical protein
MRCRQLLAAAVALAAGSDVTGEQQAENTARVLEVRPVYATVAAAVPYRQCWKLAARSTTAGGVGDPGPATRRCTLLQRDQLRREQVGFRVKYRYRGRIGTLLTGRSPAAGDRIRLRHRWRPVFF